MDESRTAGRLLVVGIPGPNLDGPTERALAEVGPAGVVLFARNLKSVSQARDLIAGVRETASATPFLALDQEGGPVNRLAAIQPVLGRLPAAREQARWAPERLEDVWRHVGEVLAALGFDVDFAPVVDLDDGAGANAIGPRSFGLDPARVTEAAGRVLAGLRLAGVAGCLKHFPGLGRTAFDTHLAACQSPLGREELEREHIEPYRRLAGDAALVMTAHAAYPSIEGPDAPPATFSREILQSWLRERIGFDGLVISDDLEMGAVATATPGERARRTFDAGSDLAMFCHDLEAPRRARDDLVRLLRRGELPGDRVLASQRRLSVLLGTFVGGRTGGADCDSRLRIAVEALDEQLPREL